MQRIVVRRHAVLGRPHARHHRATAGPRWCCATSPSASPASTRSSATSASRARCSPSGCGRWSSTRSSPATAYQDNPTALRLPADREGQATWRWSCSPSSSSATSGSSAPTSPDRVAPPGLRPDQRPVVCCDNCGEPVSPDDALPRRPGLRREAEPRADGAARQQPLTLRNKRRSRVALSSWEWPIFPPRGGRNVRPQHQHRHVRPGHHDAAAPAPALGRRGRRPSPADLRAGRGGALVGTRDEQGARRRGDA